ncbi:MAG: HigA family addiction module antitoxin [Aquisalimonadaceae bacterium]
MRRNPNPKLRGKGLRSFYESGSAAGIQPQHAKRLRMQLAALDTAAAIEDMDIPEFRLHPLKGRERNRWSVWVNGNWRLTFEFRDGNAYVLDYEVYLEPFGLSARHLAAKLKVSPSTVARVLQGRSAVSPEMALRLSKALRRSPECLSHRRRLCTTLRSPCQYRMTTRLFRQTSGCVMAKVASGAR